MRVVDDIFKNAAYLKRRQIWAKIRCLFQERADDAIPPEGGAKHSLGLPTELSQDPLKAHIAAKAENGPHTFWSPGPLSCFI